MNTKKEPDFCGSVPVIVAAKVYKKRSQLGSSRNNSRLAANRDRN